MSEKSPEQESNLTVVSKETTETVRETTVEAKSEAPHSGETAPVIEGEVVDSERKRKMEEIKASISEDGDKASATPPTPDAAAKTNLPAIVESKKKEESAPGGGGGRLGGGLAKAFKFLGTIFKFGFMATLAAGSALLEKSSKMKLGKFGGGGGGGGGGHSGGGHSAPKSGGGGHAPKAKSHGGGGGGHH